MKNSMNAEAVFDWFYGGFLAFFSPSFRRVSVMENNPITASRLAR